MVIYLIDKKINETGTMRRVCSLIDLSTPINDVQSYNAFNGSKYCITQYRFVFNT